jgi:hypothetical protein
LKIERLRIRLFVLGEGKMEDKENEQTGVNHKGKDCIYQTGLLFQEGYCTECYIYLEKDGR